MGTKRGSPRMEHHGADTHSENINTPEHRQLSNNNTMQHRLQVLDTLFTLRRRKIIPEVTQYQRAFVKNSSVDDYMFTIRRMPKENWRQGAKT